MHNLRMTIQQLHTDKEMRLTFQMGRLGNQLHTLGAHLWILIFQEGSDLYQIVYRGPLQVHGTQYSNPNP
ncbi:hypothetical protein D3C86_1869560 [compost metagenome]